MRVKKKESKKGKESVTVGHTVKQKHCLQWRVKVKSTTIPYISLRQEKKIHIIIIIIVLSSLKIKYLKSKD